MKEKQNCLIKQQTRASVKTELSVDTPRALAKSVAGDKVGTTISKLAFTITDQVREGSPAGVVPHCHLTSLIVN